VESEGQADEAVLNKILKIKQKIPLFNNMNLKCRNVPLQTTVLKEWYKAAGHLILGSK
jgi:hypothetical protein